MAGFGALLPLIATGASTAVSVAQVVNARNAAKRNEQIAKNDLRQKEMEAAREEEQQRREARSLLGKQRAAFAQAGLGSGGTSALLLDQSDVLAELDALNIRYGGQARSRGLIAQADAESRAARGTAALAGTELLYGASRAYLQSKLIQDT